MTQDSIESAYVKAVFAMQEEIKRDSPSECVLFACDVALRQLSPKLRAFYIGMNMPDIEESGNAL